MATKGKYLGTVVQRSGDKIAYTIDMSNIGTPTSPSGVITTKTDFNTNLASTLHTGSFSVSGDVITTPLIGFLTDATYYREVVTCTVSGNTWTGYFEIHCDDDEA